MPLLRHLFLGLLLGPTSGQLHAHTGPPRHCAGDRGTSLIRRVHWSLVQALEPLTCPSLPRMQLLHDSSGVACVGIDDGGMATDLSNSHLGETEGSRDRVVFNGDFRFSTCT